MFHRDVNEHLTTDNRSSDTAEAATQVSQRPVA